MTDQAPEAKSTELGGKVAVVTGGSRGIGLAIARRLAGMGASVAICARDAARLEQASREFAARGASVLAASADVTRAAEIAAFVERVQRELGPIELLVNNAGVGVFGAFHERSEADWSTVLDTNLKAVFLACRAVAPGMIRRRSGQIINIASLAGKNAFAGGGLYCASKWGLLGLSKCMMEELRVHNIRVSVICPGSVATEFSFPSGHTHAAALDADDVAHAVAMLATEGPHSFISEVDLRPRQKA